MTSEFVRPIEGHRRPIDLFKRGDDHCCLVVYYHAFDEDNDDHEAIVFPANDRGENLALARHSVARVHLVGDHREGACAALDAISLEKIAEVQRRRCNQ